MDFRGPKSKNLLLPLRMERCPKGAFTRSQLAAISIILIVFKGIHEISWISTSQGSKVKKPVTAFADGALPLKKPLLDPSRLLSQCAARRTRHRAFSSRTFVFFCFSQACLSRSSANNSFKNERFCSRLSRLRDVKMY